MFYIMTLGDVAQHVHMGVRGMFNIMYKWDPGGISTSYTHGTRGCSTSCTHGTPGDGPQNVHMGL